MNDEVIQTTDINTPPVEFEETLEINQIVEEIENFYVQLNSNNGILTRATPGTKWGNGEVVWNGGNGYIISYFWVKGSDMVSWNIVGKAQRNAVIAKYGSVNPNTSYKMKTQQFLVKTPKWQTQGYITTSARAWCYGRS